MAYIKTCYTLRVGMYDLEHIPGRVRIINTNLVTKTSIVFKLSGMGQVIGKISSVSSVVCRLWSVVCGLWSVSIDSHVRTLLRKTCSILFY